MKRTRIRPVGEAAKRRSPQWEATVKAVRLRAAGQCESCHGPCARPDPHHVFKRGNRIPRSWADRVELVAGICRICHGFVEENPRSGIQRTLEWMAVSRLARSLGLPLSGYATDSVEPLWTPLQMVRDLIRQVEGAALAA